MSSQRALSARQPFVGISPVQGYKIVLDGSLKE